MGQRKQVTFPLPFAVKPAPVRQADDPPVLFIVGVRTVLELLHHRLRTIDRPLGTLPEGHELN